MVTSNPANADTFSNALRTVCAAIDKVAFLFLEVVYKLFFEVSSTEILSNSIVAEFYGRVQLILGVFMLFQLAMTIIKGIMNPDTFTDSKSGFGNIITRIITALFILTLLVPVNISSAQNEYEQQISANGILFGTLYSLQNRILKDNTIGKLLFGADNSGTNDIEASARFLSTSVVKGFYRINLKENAKSDSDRMCPNYDYSKYLKSDVGAGDITDMVNETCNIVGKKYAFAYTPVLPTIIGIIFAGLFLSFTIDVVIRTAKLAVLRLIAPIPAISYMNPSGAKDGAFSSWTKMLTSTYIDLFVRLATVYFVIFLINGLMKNSPFKKLDGALSFFADLFVFIGLLVFAKQAPKFFKQALGIKDDGGRGFFSGMGEILAAGSIAAGTVSGAVSNGVAIGSNTKGNAGKKIAAGLIGGVTGGISGATAATKNFMTSKDMDHNALMKQVRANNAKNYRNAEDNSSFFGRIKAYAQSGVGLKNDFQAYEDKLRDYGTATTAWKNIQAALDSDDTGIIYNGETIKDSAGKEILIKGQTISSKGANDLLNRMKSSGQYKQEELEAVEDARKGIQKERFDSIRKSGGRNLDVVEKQTYQNIDTFFNIAKSYQNEKDGVFKTFKSIGSISSDGINMGRDFKGTAFSADREAQTIKSGPKYAAARSNAERVTEQQKK